jgi:hypothetical protein
MWIQEETPGVFITHHNILNIRKECLSKGIDLPEVLTDEILAEQGYLVVRPIYPNYNKISEKLIPQIPVKLDGTSWIQEFTIEPASEQEIINNTKIAELSRIADIKQQLNEGDLKIVRAILENDLERIEEWKLRAAELRAQLFS